MKANDYEMASKTVIADNLKLRKDWHRTGCTKTVVLKLSSWFVAPFQRLSTLVAQKCATVNIIS